MCGAEIKSGCLQALLHWNDRQHEDEILLNISILGDRAVRRGGSAGAVG